MPKPLSTAFGLALQFDNPEFTFEGYVFQEVNSVPIVTFNPIVAKLQELIPSQLVELQSGKAHLGLIDSISATHGL